MAVLLNVGDAIPVALKNGLPAHVYVLKACDVPSVIALPSQTVKSAGTPVMVGTKLAFTVKSALVLLVHPLPSVYV